MANEEKIIKNEGAVKVDFEKECESLKETIREKDKLIAKRTAQLNEALNAYNNFLTNQETVISTNRALFEKIVNEINEVQKG